MILCLTGMHRSATSLTASWLELCGLTIHDGGVRGPSTGNPKGHFEDTDFVKLHSSAMRQENSESNGWKIFCKDFLKFENGQRAYANKLLRDRSTKYNTWGWKDPRSVYFLDEWKKIVPELKVLLVWRPCAEVAYSLTKRSREADYAVYRISLLESAKLWKSYNEKVCRYKRQYQDDTLLFSLKTIVTQDRSALDLLNDRFHASLIYRPITEVYDPEILHRGATPALVRLLALYYGCWELEKKLWSLSDLVLT